MVYSVHAGFNRTNYFEVDSTESVWYINFHGSSFLVTILKLTPQSQYGIIHDGLYAGQDKF